MHQNYILKLGLRRSVAMKTMQHNPKYTYSRRLNLCALIRRVNRRSQGKQTNKWSVVLLGVAVADIIRLDEVTDAILQQRGMNRQLMRQKTVSSGRVAADNKANQSM